MTQSSRGDTGKWICERSTVVASWKSGNIDRITLSPDGTQASVTNGTAFRSSLDELKAEILNTDQGRIELLASRLA